MSPLSRKSNRCALCGAIMLHLGLMAACCISVSLAFEVPDTPPVESVYITLAEPVSAPAPLAEVVPVQEAVREEIPEPMPEEIPEAVNVEPEKKRKPEPEKQAPKPRPKPAPNPKPAVAGHRPETAVSQSGEQVADQKAMQNAVSALLARLEKEKRYPNSARRLGLQGSVLINVNLDSNGNIRSYTLSADGSHAILQKSAMQAMERVQKKWQPVELSKAMSVQVPVRFELN